MRAALLLAAVAAALATAAAAPAAAPSGQECAGIQTCIDVPGPWVAVPARGAAQFLLDCPQRRGVVGGVDAFASSRDVHVTFDALLGSPVAPGRSTTRYAFFRAVSARHVAGLFQPRIGCIPSSGGQRATTSARVVTPAGAPLDLAAVTFPVRPGMVRQRTIACARGEHLVGSWTATAFTAATPPVPGFAKAVRAVPRVHRGVVSVTVIVSEALPLSTGAEVQIGVSCAQ